MSSLFIDEAPEIVVPDIFAGQTSLSKLSGLYLYQKEDDYSQDDFDNLFSPSSFVSDLIQDEKLLSFNLDLKLTLFAQKVIKDFLISKFPNTKPKSIIFKNEEDDLKALLSNSSAGIMAKTQKQKSGKLASNKEINQFINSRMKIINSVVSSIESEIREVAANVLQTLTNIQTISQTANQILDKIKDKDGPISKSRVQRITRTESVIARNYGIFEAVKIFKDLEKVTSIQWVTVLDRRVRHSHRKMHGKKVKVGSYFRLPSGVRMKFPCDPDAIGPTNSILAETINCRCTIRTLKT